MRIPIRVRYSYTQYPYSKKATAWSKFLGGITSWPCWILYFCFINLSVMLILINTVGVTNEMGNMITIASLVATPFLVKAVRKAGEKKIAEFAKKDYLNQLQKNHR